MVDVGECADRGMMMVTLRVEVEVGIVLERMLVVSQTGTEQWKWWVADRSDCGSVGGEVGMREDRGRCAMGMDRGRVGGDNSRVRQRRETAR